MRIRRVEAWKVELPFHHPYTIAYETITACRAVAVQLVTDGPVGVGFACPDPAVTGDDVDDARLALSQVDAGPLDCWGHAHPERWVDPGSPSARAALQMALLDLLGKHVGVPAYRLLGASRRSLATSVTLGIDDLEPTVNQARSWVGHGFTALKLKGGLDVDEDVARVRAVRDAVGFGVRLRFDANQGYSLDQARRFVRGVTGLGLEVLEQPTDAARPALLGQLSSPIPLMADESAQTPADVLNLAGLVTMVNLKPARVGGLAVARRMAAVARAAGMRRMVGCVDEPALSIAASLAFALAEGVELADLDGHLDLVDDPTAAALRCVEGALHPSEQPGLGVRSL